MLIITEISRTPEGSDGPEALTVTATYGTRNPGVSNVYDYDDDAGPRLNHSAAMRRLAEIFVGKDMAYDGDWIGVMISTTTCAWTRKSYTIS